MVPKTRSMWNERSLCRQTVGTRVRKVLLTFDLAIGRALRFLADLASESPDRTPSLLSTTSPNSATSPV